MHRTLVIILVALLSGCVSKNKTTVHSLAAPGRTRFEIYGMLSEYGARFSDGRRVEGFYPHETAVAAHFEALLRALCAEESISLTFDKGVGPEGHIVFSSPVIAAAIDRHFTGGALEESVFTGASEEDLLRYIAGTYLRFGDEKKGAVVFAANASRKLHTAGLVLSRLGCTRVRLYSTKMAMVPTSFVLIFSPSQTVMRRLGIQNEVAVSDLTDFKNTLELEEEIPPNQAPEPSRL